MPLRDVPHRGVVARHEVVARRPARERVVEIAVQPGGEPAEVGLDGRTVGAHLEVSGGDLLQAFTHLDVE